MGRFTVSVLSGYKDSAGVSRHSGSERRAHRDFEALQNAYAVIDFAGV
jgi:hypothetical protein